MSNPDGTPHPGNPRKQPRAASRSIERELHGEGYTAVAGVDEAGCGALAGPVVAGAAILAPDTHIPHLTDSKLLSPGAREELYWAVRDKAVAWAMALLLPRDIDQLNIFRARMLAMNRAVEALTTAADFALVDGTALPPLNIPARALVDGDRKCRAIAAGSIIAKVMRDSMMAKLDALYPQYGFGAHKGYATREHIAAIEAYGPSPVHRMSVAPITRLSQATLDFD
jgi:ribonuclease HII